ncbi:MAG: peptide-binding protein [bacterium]|nr:MAG: peptide-binding protein [bacterium]
MTKRTIVLLTTFLAFFLTALFLIASYRLPIYKKPFIILVSREPDTLSFLFSHTAASLLPIKAIFRGLVGYDNNLKPFPELAKEVPTLENGLVELIDGGRMKVTWRLRENLKWADGHPLTPEDVLFTYRILKDKRIITFVWERDDAKLIEDMQIVDKNTFVVIWKRKYNNYLMTHPLLPKHLLEKPYLEDPEGFDKLSYHRDPVGNGPYKLIRWEPGSYLLLEANKYYHKPVRIPRIALKIVQDVNSILVNLLSGEGDACTTLAPEQFHFMKQRYKDQVKVYSIPGMGWIHADVNLSDPILRDKQVRMALLHGINRSAIAKYMSYGTLSVADSWIPPKHYGYSPSKYKYTYDPKKAKILLKKAGWIANPDGILEKNGKKLTLNILTNSKDKNRERIAIFIKEDLKRLGIQVNVQLKNSSIILGKNLPNRSFQLALFAWYFHPRLDGSEYWPSSKIPSKKNKLSGANY